MALKAGTHQRGTTEQDETGVEKSPIAVPGIRRRTSAKLSCSDLYLKRVSTRYKSKILLVVLLSKPFSPLKGDLDGT